ncbi:MAG: glycine cleavage T C-terminal barrel domain-containing protein, partial [Myxococcota bacterium]|nr:glycine cleavage T C-terminal barrel domain-containing protein [Myxococcota bacterium]
MNTGVYELARAAREQGLCGLLGDTEGLNGLARFGAIRIEGRDASSFLHSQLTNEVKELEVGQGNLNARVKRTGHLVESFSLHRLPDQGDAGVFLLLGELDGVRRIAEDLDAYLFADEVEISEESGVWLALQGGPGESILEGALGEETAWSTLSEYTVVECPGARVVVRSLTGDRGYLVGLDAPDPTEFLKEAGAAGLQVLQGAELSDVLETLRLEAGQIRVGADCDGRARLLPETGLEQHAVSYTKGCYLGQEVIARVRTYGSVPYALRGLVLEVKGSETGEEALSCLPAPGEDLLVEGQVVGAVGARVRSPVLESPIALAYLNRASRTPGQELQLDCGVTVTVALLPFYRAPDAEARVAFLYDRAIRVFAGGDEPGALALLADALRLEPTFADAYELIGVILGRSGR